jgi:prepilin-type N-terminal cleavage/methylation domain-containing protein
MKRGKLQRLAMLNNDAFTLIELLIALAITGIVVQAIYGVFVWRDLTPRVMQTQESKWPQPVSSGSRQI